MRLLLVLAIVIVASPVAAAPLPDCPTEGKIELATKTAANLHTTYTLAGGDLRVCIDRAQYPYRGGGRGHFLYSCFTVATSGRNGGTKHVCGEGNTYFDWGGYRVHISMRTPRFVDASDVWLEIERKP